MTRARSSSYITIFSKLPPAVSKRRWGRPGEGGEKKKNKRESIIGLFGRSKGVSETDAISSAGTRRLGDTVIKLVTGDNYRRGMVDCPNGFVALKKDSYMRSRVVYDDGYNIGVISTLRLAYSYCAKRRLIVTRTIRVRVCVVPRERE